jgi:hypothetical protein
MKDPSFQINFYKINKTLNCIVQSKINKLAMEVESPTKSSFASILLLAQLR